MSSTTAATLCAAFQATAAARPDKIVKAANASPPWPGPRWT